MRCFGSTTAPFIVKLNNSEKVFITRPFAGVALLRCYTLINKLAHMPQISIQIVQMDMSVFDALDIARQVFDDFRDWLQCSIRQISSNLNGSGNNVNNRTCQLTDRL